MKILFYTQHFNLPEEPGFSRPYQFAKRWAEKGNDVTVITSAYNYHAGLIIKRDRNKLLSIEHTKGIKIIRIGLKGYSFKNEVIFSIIATLLSLFLRKRDVMIASSKPLTTGIPALSMSFLWRRPFLLEVRDLYTYCKPRYRRFYSHLEKILYASAKKIIGVSAFSCEDIIRAGKPKEDVIHIPHGADDWVLDTAPAPSSGSETPDKIFKCVLAGSVMKISGIDFDVFMETAEILRDKPDIHFFVIGRGNYVDGMKRKGLGNISFLGALSKKETIRHIRLADLGIVPLREKMGGARVDWIMPVKLFDYFGCAKPVVAIAPQYETREIVVKSGGGILVETGNARSLAKAILHIKSLSPEERYLMGKRAFEYTRKHYNLAGFADNIEAVCVNLSGE